MIDYDNLRTASLYINNQLLSRGLLRDGQNIDFADPGDADGDAAQTMGRVISVINDLILRRDRDAEQRESLSATMRSLRAENQKYAVDLARLTDRHAEAQRRVDIADSAEAALKTQLKSADAALRGLRDELARTKTLVAQTRASCATEIRRRDRQADGLKKQLAEAGRARGSRANPAVITINVPSSTSSVNGYSSKNQSTSSDQHMQGNRDDDGNENGDHDLRGQTDDFLATMARTLSEENETMLATVRNTLQQLREMSGFQNSDSNQHNSSKGQQPHIHGHGEGQVIRSSKWEDVNDEIADILAHMKTILTNPSFVPIEEVEVREEEINRLKQGWVKMESRWREAVHLIDGWRRRMAASGKPVLDEDLRKGLRLGSAVGGAASDFNVPTVPVDLGLTMVMDRHLQQYDEEYDDEAGIDEDEEEAEGDIDLISHASDDDVADDDPDMEDELDDAEMQEGDGQDEAARIILKPEDSPPLPEPPRLSPLRNSSTAGNRGSALSRIRAKYQRPAQQARMTDPPQRPMAPPKPQSSPKRTSLDDALLPPEVEEDEDVKMPGVENVVAPALERTKDKNAPLNKPSATAATGTGTRRTTAATMPSSSSTLKKSITNKHAPPVNLESNAYTESRHTTNTGSSNSQEENREANLPPHPSPPRRHLVRRLDASSPAATTKTSAQDEITAKLAASERAAAAARVRAKLQSVRGSRGPKRPRLSDMHQEQIPQESKIREEKPQQQQAKQQQRIPSSSLPVKTSTMTRINAAKTSMIDTRETQKTRVVENEENNENEDIDARQSEEIQVPPQDVIRVEKRKRRTVGRASKVLGSRRRSTLNPWELESLITGKAQ